MPTVTNKIKFLEITYLASTIIGIPTPNLLDSVTTFMFRKPQKNRK